MLSDALQYSRAAVDAGEWWRFATASFVHWSLNQLLWDGIAFVALACVAWRLSRTRFAVAFIASAIAIPICIHLFAPNVATYRGLSGVDSALFVLVAMLVGKRARIVLLLFAAKIAFEFATGTTLFVHELAPGVASLPIAHVIGAAIGLLSQLRLQRPQLLGQSSNGVLESLHAYGEWFSA
jgi:rhomboid family GlyGly-CTERM serine protease